MKKLLLTAIVALSAAVAGANDYIEHQIYSDTIFPSDIIATLLQISFTTSI